MNEQAPESLPLFSRMSTRIALGVGGTLLTVGVTSGLLYSASEHHNQANRQYSAYLDAEAGSQAKADAKTRENDEQDTTNQLLVGSGVVALVMGVATYRAAYGRFRRDPEDQEDRSIETYDVLTLLGLRRKNTGVDNQR